LPLRVGGAVDLGGENVWTFRGQFRRFGVCWEMSAPHSDQADDGRAALDVIMELSQQGQRGGRLQELPLHHHAEAGAMQPVRQPIADCSELSADPRKKNWSLVH